MHILDKTMPSHCRNALPRSSRSRLEWNSEFDGEKYDRTSVVHTFDVGSRTAGVAKTLIVGDEPRWRKGGMTEPISADLIRQCLWQKGQQSASSRCETWRSVDAENTRRLQRTLHCATIPSPPPAPKRQSPLVVVQNGAELAVASVQPPSPADSGSWQDMSISSQPSPQPPTSLVPSQVSSPASVAPQWKAEPVVPQRPPESPPIAPKKKDLTNGKAITTEALPVQECVAKPRIEQLPVHQESVESALIEQPHEASSQEVAAAKYALYSAKATLCKEAFRELEREPSLKALKSAALFASSNPVSICSANSPMEIIEPYRKAFLLLRGARLETNTVPLALADHPQLVHFVRYNMARKFIDVAALQTEEKNETKLLALAALLTELWACDAEFGEVFLALLYTDCPSLVPVPYTLDANVDVYLRRLGALSKFYAAIMQTDRRLLLARLFPTKHFPGVNPHGAEAAWALLAQLVNGQVQLGITVLVLRNLLTMAGWLLAGTYGKQFSKLVALISRRMLPRVRQRTPAELLGPVERLADSLEDFHRLQTFPVPPRRLDQEFWSS